MEEVSNSAMQRLEQRLRAALTVYAELLAARVDPAMLWADLQRRRTRGAREVGQDGTDAPGPPAPGGRHGR
jgi:hypothetical protein